jgi:hypothetical protein
MTNALHTRALSLVSGWVGGAPRAAARAVAEEDDAMISNGEVLDVQKQRS